MYLVPCKDCTKRELNCHSTCTDYKDYKEKIDEARRKEQKYNTYASVSHDALLKRHKPKIFIKEKH